MSVSVSESHHNQIFDQVFPSSLFPRNNRLPSLAHVSHHLAHAASAFRCSDFERAVVLVIDGRGEHTATTIALGEDNTIKPIRSFDISQSLGYFYSSVSHFVGLPDMSEGKTMGLAAWGEPIYSFDNIKLTEIGYQIQWPHNVARNDAESTAGNCNGDVFSAWREYLSEHFVTPNKVMHRYDPVLGRRIPATAFGKLHKDIAASAQKRLEDVCLHLVRTATNETGIRDCTLAGGVALNCSMNGKLSQSGLIDALYIQPAAHDSGTCIGAALEFWARLGHVSRYSMPHAYFGPSYSDTTLRGLLDSAHVYYKECNDPAEAAASRLASGRVIGWFQGRMEFGPRALGNRSILAHPGMPGMRDYLNEEVKHREGFRPYALAIREECRDMVLGSSPESRLMLLALPVLGNKRELVAEGIHIDGTTRPQTVRRADNPPYWELLREFERLTGVPALLNTSFNDAGEPLVCTPRDALRTFFSTALDDLFIGPFHVSKDCST